MELAYKGNGGIQVGCIEPLEQDESTFFMLFNIYKSSRKSSRLKSFHWNHVCVQVKLQNIEG